MSSEIFGCLMYLLSCFIAMGFAFWLDCVVQKRNKKMLEKLFEHYLGCGSDELTNDKKG